MKDKVYNCSENSIKKAGRLIKEGRIVIYPTDTLYGVGCSALNEDGVKRLFEIKKRDPSNPLSIAVSDLKMLRRHTSFDEKALRVMERFLPGPVTLILRKRNLPDILTGGGEKIGVRIPETRTALKLIIEAQVPIVSTSANVSGSKPAETAHEALRALPHADMALDGGRISGPPSTVIDLTESPPKIIREGKKPVAEIVEVLSEIYSF